MKKIKGRIQRKKSLKKIKFIIFLILIVIVGKNIRYVDAGMNDSVITKNRVNDIYAIGMVDGKEHLYYLNMYQMNGRVAYCIEMGKDITSDIYHSTADFSILSLTEEQIRYIRVISYYGYQYPGHTSYYYYMAAQELIWEYLSNGTMDVEWTNELDVNGGRIDISRYLNQILSFVTLYDNDIRFVLQDGTEWTDGKIYSLGEKIILKDVSQLLPLYDIELSGHADVTINRDVLSIQLSDDYVGTETIKLTRKNQYDYSSVLYYYDNSQKLISNGNYYNFQTEIYFHVKGSELRGQVIDKETKDVVPQGDASLEGAIYKLYNENKELLGTYETESDGSFLVDNLGYGTYYIKQIQASDGYLINDEEVMFVFSEDNTKIILEQEVISNVIEIQKVYEQRDGIYKLENNILFQIYDSKNELYGEMITDENGKASMIVPYGVYTVRQGNVMTGYSTVDDFEVNTKEGVNQRFYYHLVNTLIRCKIKVVSYEKDSGKKIELTGFSYRIKRKNEDRYLEVDGQEIFQANENGELIFPMLFSYDDYILELVSVPKEIFLEQKEMEIIIDDKADFEMIDGSFVTKIDVYHTFIKGKINVISNEEVFYSELNDYGYRKVSRENILFSLIASEDILVNGEIFYKKGDVVIEDMTDNYGKLSISNLNLGKYCLRDKETEQEKCFNLETITNDEKLVEIDVEFTKKLDKGNIQLKNNSSDGGVVFGTVFEIYNKDNEKIYIGATNEEGILKIPNLLYGDYCIFQKKVANGYQLNQEKQCLVVDGDELVEFMNRKVEKRIIFVPDTFLDGEAWRKIIFMVLIGIGVFVYKKVSLRNNN